MSGGSIRHFVRRPARNAKRCLGTRAFAGSLGSAAAGAFCTGAAIAADLPFARAPVAPVASATAAIYTWTGFYIGGQVGAGVSRSCWGDPMTRGSHTFLSGAGLLGRRPEVANHHTNTP